MVNGSGGFIGPDLSDYGATHSADDIRDAILTQASGQDLTKLWPKQLRKMVSNFRES